MRNCWIFDIDGTLCNSSRQVSYSKAPTEDWSGYDEEIANDPVHEDILQFYIYAAQKKIPIFICTGRSETYRKTTQAWLFKHNITEVIAMFMRDFNDSRQDDVIKKEMLDGIRAAGFNPVMVFEDRDRVVKMWRDNGVRCLQVQEGNF